MERRCYRVAPQVGDVRPAMIALMSGAAPEWPSVMLGIATPPFSAADPDPSCGTNRAVISVQWSGPSGTVEANGSDASTTSPSWRCVDVLKTGSVGGSPAWAPAREE